MGDEDVDAKRSRPSIGKPAMCHARKERVLLIGTDQRITSGPAARTAASRGRIHGCTRILSRKVRFFSLAPRAPSIHGCTRIVSRKVRFFSLAPRAPSIHGTKCEGWHGSFGALHEATLVAHSPYALVDPNRTGSIGASACFGDSGGPVLRGGMLVGIITRAAHPSPRLACGH